MTKEVLSNPATAEIEERTRNLKDLAYDQLLESVSIVMGLVKTYESEITSIESTSQSEVSAFLEATEAFIQELKELDSFPTISSHKERGRFLIGVVLLQTQVLNLSRRWITLLHERMQSVSEGLGGSLQEIERAIREQVARLDITGKEEPTRSPEEVS